MGQWNRSSEASKVTPKKKPSAMRGIAAGALVVVALAALCIWMFSGGENAPKAKVEKERGRIKEVTPAQVDTNSAPLVKVEAPKEMSNKERIEAGKSLKYVKDENGDVWDKTTGKFIKHAPKTVRKRPRYCIFPRRSENMIAQLLTMEPGEPVFGEINYGERFKQDFLKSCEVPIIVSPDDNEYDRELKKAMNETKIALRQRMADGEDLEQIMKESRNALRELGLYKREVENQIREIQRKEKGNLTETDYQDLLSAADKMLESRGCSPLKNKDIMTQRFKLQAARLHRENSQETKE